MKSFKRNLIAWILLLAMLFCVSCDLIPFDIESSLESNTEFTESTTLESDPEPEPESASESDIDSKPSTESFTESDNSQTEEPSTDSPSTEESSTGSDTTPPDSIPPLEIVEKNNSTSTHIPATSYEDALQRSENGILSGYDYVPDQAPVISKYRPTKDGMYIKNTDAYYIDVNTYVVLDAYGREIFRIYRGGAYITLEEIAAYVYAFGEPPANHSASKRTKPNQSIWGIYLRINNTKFSGSVSKYPYEPKLPRISGCGGDLQYWEMDIGTTGTDCDPGYIFKVYNDGTTITRGAARIVYTWNDLNDNQMADPTDDIYVFYTYNHYNDFQEYLNYYGGWGEMFGNVTGGGTLSSKTDYNPTPYVPVYDGSIKISKSTAEKDIETAYIMYAWIDRRAFDAIVNA